MANLYQLAEELNVTPKTLERWLKSNGLGGGKSISNRATQSARAHFKDTSAHPMADALQDREGLGDVARHEDLIISDQGVRVEERPKLRWGKVERGEVDVQRLDMGAQKDFFKQLRSGDETTSHSSDLEAPQSSPQATPSSALSQSVSSHPQRGGSSAGVRSTSRSASSRRRSTKHKSEVSGGVFGALAPLAHQLESVTDRRAVTPQRPDPLADQRALEAMREGVSPLTPDQSVTSPVNSPASSERKGRKDRKGQRGRKGRKGRKGLRVEREESRASQAVIASPESASQATSSKAPAKTRPIDEASFQELFERPQVQALQAQIEKLNQRLHEVTHALEEARATATLDPLQSAHEPPSSSTTELLESTQERAPELIWDHLASFGLNVTQARLALLELLDHPQRGPELMYSLKHDQPKTLTRGFSIVCSAMACQEVASVHARQGLIELEERHLCTICQGSDARGWYRRLTLTAIHTQRDRILVVGGDDADHRQIKELARQHSGVTWDFIAGGTRLSQTVANAKVAHKAAVVLWGGVHLPHALSNLVKSSADRAGVPCFALEPGTRSIATLCREVLKCWGVTYE